MSIQLLVNSVTMSRLMTLCQLLLMSRSYKMLSQLWSIILKRKQCSCVDRPTKSQMILSMATTGLVPSFLLIVAYQHVSTCDMLTIFLCFWKDAHIFCYSTFACSLFFLQLADTRWEQAGQRHTIWTEMALNAKDQMRWVLVLHVCTFVCSSHTQTCISTYYFFDILVIFIIEWKWHGRYLRLFL